MIPTLIVSLDFELYWGEQDCGSEEQLSSEILGGKKAIPQMLKLFERYDIHATWATVGFIFASSVNEIKRYMPKKEHLPGYTKKELSTYRCVQNVENKEIPSSLYIAPSIVNKIAQVPGQEIGSHTFSHYYCREQGQKVEQFRADLKSAISIAEAKGYDLTSIVFPRNQTTTECVKVLSEYGFSAYRDEENDWIHKIKLRPLMRLLRLVDVYFPLTGQGGYIPTIEHNVVKLQGSRMYKPYFKTLAFMEKLKIHRIKKQMLHAAKNGLVFHLWWHPHNIGLYTDFHLKQLEEIFQYYQELKKRFGMRSLNMHEVALETMKG